MNESFGSATFLYDNPGGGLILLIFDVLAVVETSLVSNTGASITVVLGDVAFIGCIFCLDITGRLDLIGGYFVGCVAGDGVVDFMVVVCDVCGCVANLAVK